MKHLREHAFKRLVRSRIDDRVRGCRKTDFQSVAGDLLDRGLVPNDQALWDWARQICDRKAA